MEFTVIKYLWNTFAHDKQTQSKTNQIHMSTKEKARISIKNTLNDKIIKIFDLYSRWKQTEEEKES